MIRLFNTQTRNKEALEPVHPGEVRIYVCGPTVYNYIHIGNARTFLSFDVIRRYLTFSGMKVTFVQNITDVDDKIINAAADEDISAVELAEKYEAAFVEQMDALGVASPDFAPHATTEIEPMIELVETLIERGHAYVAEDPRAASVAAGQPPGNDVYFEVRSFPAYGSLSGRSLDEMRAGERVEINPLKRDPMDFALWKAAKPGEPFWPSPWGPGRPGWHLECSEMSAKYLGIPFDIHGGACDLVFPHHENEKAQSEAAHGAFVKYWVHGGLLNINQEKMSKSLGNFTLLKDVLDELSRRGHDRTASANIVRLLMLQTHYRSPLEFSDDRLAEAAAALERLTTAVANLDWLVALPDSGGQAPAQSEELARASEDTRARFVEAMDDDFNTAEALAVLFELVRAGNAVIAAAGPGGIDTETRTAAATARSELVELASVAGLRLETGLALGPEIVGIAAQLAGYEGDSPADAADALLERRAEARAAKDWAGADAIRDRLAGIGLVVEDTPQGQRLLPRS